MVQYEMYFANEYTEEIVYDLVEVMGLYVEKKDIQVAMQEKNKYSLDNLLLLKGESGSICIDCNDKDWIFPLVVKCHERLAPKLKQIMLKWDNLIREEYAQTLSEDICNVYGKAQTLSDSIEKYYGITI